MADYWVYIMTNPACTLYVGVTNDLERRVYEHKVKLVPGFTSRCGLDRLAYYEVTEDVNAAIAREKQLKGWLRRKKIALIEVMNPQWEDLSLAWQGKEAETLRGVYPEERRAQGDNKKGAQGDSKGTDRRGTKKLAADRKGDD